MTSLSEEPRAFLRKHALVRVLLPLLVAAPLARANEVARLNDEAITHLRASRPEKAFLLFELALQRRPGSRTLQRNTAASLAAVADLRRKESKPGEAVDALDRAVELHPSRLAYRVLRGRARYELDRDADRYFARQDFEYVLDRDPEHLAALINLGQIAYVERRLAEAVALWERAQRLRPDDPDIRSRLQKARRELKVEADYAELRSSQFLLRYSEKVKEADAAAVLAACEEAYSELCQKFDHYPDNAATVVTLYTPSEFRAATRLHGWVTGLSDGTIRVTMGRGSGRIEAVRRTIFHEFAHHLIRDVAPAAPGWLHEGLAQLAEKKSPRAAENRLRRAADLHSADLSMSVLRQRDARRVSRFYDLSLAFTEYLRSQGGDASILKLLQGFGATAEKTPAGEQAALQEVYGASRGELFARWRAQLRRG